MKSSIVYYTKDEIKQLLRISERTYFRWVKSGKLKRVKIGNKSLFAVKEIEKLLSSNEK